jgi:hypothetical protein
MDTLSMEFLMLFLAVFCGFLAEYQLEHKIEKDKEKQYMQSFIYDLQNDTATLNTGFSLKDQRIRAIDSVFLFLNRTRCNNNSRQGFPVYVQNYLGQALPTKLYYYGPVKKCRWHEIDPKKECG